MSDPNPTSNDSTSDTSKDSKSGDKSEAKADDKPLGENGEKALKAERDARAAAEKAAAALQKQLDEINAANLSDLEKAQKKAADAEAAAVQAQAESLRYRIASESGITENADLILTGADEETMRKQAALWAERTPTSPRPDLSQGSKGDNASGSTADMFAAAIEGSFTR
jgi:hypothetical protein